MRLLVDTNIIIDHLRARNPFVLSAKKLMTLGFLHEFELWISVSQVMDVRCLLADGGKPSLAREVKVN